MMKDLLWAESQKLHRSKILWIAGFATVMVGLIVFAQGQFTFYDRRYIDGAGWFMTAAQSLATFYVLPAVIALLGSYMICREEQEDTLKSLRLIPVDEVKLTLAKMILAFVFSVLIYLLLFAITFLVEAVLHLEALSVGLVLENLKIYFLDVYTGAMVLGKTKTLISGKSIVRTVPKGKQFITAGTHEAIVSREEFEKAQLVIKSNSHKVLMGGVDFPLKGKVRCGNCRRVMAHNFKQAVPTFWCREGLELVGQTQCTSEVFQVSDIENEVLQALKKELSLLDSLYGDKWNRCKRRKKLLRKRRFNNTNRIKAKRTGNYWTESAIKRR